MQPLISVDADSCISQARQQQLALQCNIPQQQTSGISDYLLYQSEQRLELRATNNKQVGAVYAEFVEGKAKHRRLYGGGKGQHIAKAIGLHKFSSPQILDLTAGLGRDAFVLASLGCQVTLLERSAIIHALLEDAIQRGQHSKDQELLPIIARMNLQHCDAGKYLTQLDKPADVIYIDPMFPERNKTASVKKEMRFFHAIAGSDADSSQLLPLARQKASKRIVVKRPRLAEPLNQQKPNFVITGKSTRYDVYLPV